MLQFGNICTRGPQSLSCLRARRYHDPALGRGIAKHAIETPVRLQHHGVQRHRGVCHTVMRHHVCLKCAPCRESSVALGTFEPASTTQTPSSRLLDSTQQLTSPTLTYKQNSKTAVLTSGHIATLLLLRWC